MKRMNNRAITLLSVVSVVILPFVLKCTSAQETAGGDISVVDNKVCGIIYDPTGRPSYDASVVMRSVDYLPELGRLGKHSAVDEFFVCSTHTDHNGYYRFASADSIPVGNYLVEARDSMNNCALIGNIKIDSFLYFSTIDTNLATEFTCTLKPPGTIRGTMQPSGDSITGTVFIYGLDTYAEITRDGSFVLNDVPPGCFRMCIITEFEGTKQKDLLTITTTSGDTTAIDAVHHISFDGNANSGGNAPVDTRLYNTGDTVVVPGNGGNLTKSGYAFTGWNTKTDGSGDTSMPGDWLIMGDTTIVLHALWKPARYILTVTGNAHGTVSGADSVEHGVTHNITATADSGYPFVVWRVIEGTATIADSTAWSTVVTLENGNAAVRGFFTTITFKKTFNFDTYASGDIIRQTSDDGYIIAGSNAGSIVPEDVRLIKTDVFGDTIWTRLFTATQNIRIYSIVQTIDGGYIIAGRSGTTGENVDIYLMKMTAAGDVAWTKTFGGSFDDNGYSVQQTTDGGYIIAGDFGVPSYSDVYLIKTTANGTAMWTKTFGGAYNDIGYSVCQTTDGGYIIAGETIDPDTWMKNMYLIKMTANGDTVWTKTFGGVDHDFCHSVQQTNDGGYLIAGGTNVIDETLVYLVKTTSAGDTMWTKTFTGTNFENYTGLHGNFIQQNINGGYSIGMILATAQSSTGQCRIVTITPDAEIIQTKTLPVVPMAIQPTNDGGFIMSEYYHNPKPGLYLIKTDENGMVKSMN